MSILATLLILGAAAQPAGEGQALAQRLSGAQPESPADVSALARSLASLGPGHADELLLAWSLAELPPEWLANGATPEPLSEGAHEATLEALAQLAAEPLRAALEAMCLREWEPRERCGALALITRRSVGRDLELALALATPPAVDAPVDRELRAELRSALSICLEREPGAATVLHLRFPALAPAIIPAVAGALSELPPAQAVEHLASCLDSVPGADPMLLSELARIGPGVPAPTPPQARRLVRERLTSEDPRVASLAARAAGALRDDEAVGPLIELLGQGASGPRDAARSALCGIAGLDHGLDTSAWKRWHLAELTFWRKEGPALLRDLPTLSAPEQVAAARALASRRLYRGEIAEALLACLESPESGVLLATCAALEELGVRASAEALRPLLTHPEAPVRRAATSALEHLSTDSRPR